MNNTRCAMLSSWAAAHRGCDHVIPLCRGCADDDTSADASSAYGAPGGAMTTAFCDVLQSNPCPSYPELMDQLNRLLRRRGPWGSMGG